MWPIIGAFSNISYVIFYLSPARSVVQKGLHTHRNLLQTTNQIPANSDQNTCFEIRTQPTLHIIYYVNRLWGIGLIIKYIYIKLLHYVYITEQEK
jgi:hypothetical protein